MASTDQSINGHPSALTTERAVEDLRRGRTIQILDGSRGWLMAAVETLSAPQLERLQRVENFRAHVVLTPQRARSAGLLREATGPVAVAIPCDARLAMLRALAGLEPEITPSTIAAVPVPLESVAEAGCRLAKLGRLVPALLLIETGQIEDPGLLSFHVDALADRAELSQQTIELISRARVPLIDALDCEIVLFRLNGKPGQHLAIVIDAPSGQAEVPVRLHSACLTGDVLGSLRCDCGDQLKRAISRIGNLGGGVLLYLDQEGRGIGLANKLRAYALQDAGLDTLDADEHLGFRPDERDYAAAAAMLRELGIHRVRLLTNNPAKIAALQQHGIEVAGRLPLVASVNAYNQRYLKAKLDRAGHLAE